MLAGAAAGFGLSVQASGGAAAQLIGAARLTVWGFEVYNARLLAAPGFQRDRYAQHPFTLELAYLRSFDGSDIAQRSLKEMQRVDDFSDAQAQKWLAEMTRLGVALGARAETFMGLSGLGDLVLTATGDLSRNRRVGQLLAQGLSLQQAVDSLGHVAEGVYSARTVVQRAAVAGVDMPISEAVVALLDGRLRPVEAVAALMGREPKLETV